MTVPLTDQIKCAKREVAMRERAYPKWVQAGRMKREAAEYELAAMRAVVATLEAMMSDHLTKWPDDLLSPTAAREYHYMLEEAPKRGGYLWEGARPVYERGGYKDHIIDELLAVGAIEPHADPDKGWVAVLEPRSP